MKYILKLHIHQHSLLTRKVFFLHNFQHKSSSLSSGSSSSPRHLQVFFIFKSYSSSSHLHVQVIFIIGSGSSLDLDHHWTSSLDLDHHWTSSLDMDHHCWIWIIITRFGSSLGHHNGCYLLILLIIGI